MTEKINLITAIVNLVAAAITLAATGKIPHMDANTITTTILLSIQLICVIVLICTTYLMTVERKRKETRKTDVITPEEVEEAERRLKRDGERAARDLHDELVRSELKQIKKENRNE